MTKTIFHTKHIHCKEYEIIEAGELLTLWKQFVLQSAHNAQLVDEQMIYRGSEYSDPGNILGTLTLRLAISVGENESSEGVI